MAAYSLRHHMEGLHGIVLPHIRGGRRRRKRSGDIQGVVPAHFEVSGMPGGGMPGKGKNSKNNEG